MALSCTDAAVASKRARKWFSLLERLILQGKCAPIDLALLAAVSDTAKALSGTLTD